MSKRAIFTVTLQYHIDGAISESLLRMNLCAILDHAIAEGQITEGADGDVGCDGYDIN